MTPEEAIAKPIKRYRKKSLIIEAVQLQVGRAALITDWMGRDSNGNCLHADWDGSSFHIRTLEGVMTANRGDWIIKGIKGEFYPCKDDIFRGSYDEMENQAVMKTASEKVDVEKLAAQWLQTVHWKDVTRTDAFIAGFEAGRKGGER